MQLVKDTPLRRSLFRFGQSVHLELCFNLHALYSDVVLRRLWSACNFGPGTTYMYNYSCNYLQLQYHANAGHILMEQHIVKIRPMPHQNHFGHLTFCSTVLQSRHFGNLSSSKQRLIQYCSNAIILITFAALDFESLSSSFRNSLFGYGIVIPAKALKPQIKDQTRRRGFHPISHPREGDWKKERGASPLHKFRERNRQQAV